MTRRDFSYLGLSSLGTAALAGAALGQEDRRDRTSVEPQHVEHMRECAKICSDCQRECDACATHCGRVLADGKREHFATLMTCRDCADFCTAAAQIVARLGPFAALICQACADACARCGKECEKYPNDEHMKRCAEECRKCEKACNDMVKTPGGSR